MRFYSNEECEDWLKGRGRSKPGADNQPAALRLSFPKDIAGTYRWANWFSQELQPCLLWITEFMIFPSSENWQLYYTLRHAEHDYRLLPEAPGHLFLDYERHLFASFLQVAMLNAWGGYVLDEYNYFAMFFSHDEYCEVYAADTKLIEHVRDNLTR